MTKRNVIYAVLALFITAGMFIDVYVWPGGTPARLTWNDLLQMVGIVTLASWWQIADAAELGIRRSSAARFVTVLFVPVGSAIYLFQSRHWKSAVLAYLVFWGGLVAVAAAAAYLATVLAINGVFGTLSP